MKTNLLNLVLYCLTPYKFWGGQVSYTYFLSPTLISLLLSTWPGEMFYFVSHQTATGLSRISTYRRRSLPDIYVKAKLNHSHKPNTGNRLLLGVGGKFEYLNKIYKSMRDNCKYHSTLDQQHWSCILLTSVSLKAHFSRLYHSRELEG